MQLQRYHDTDQCRIAMITQEGRIWMRVMVIDGGGLKIVKRPMADQQYMRSLPWTRKNKASIRRLARKKGTTRAVRKAVKEI